VLVAVVLLRAVRGTHLSAFDAHHGQHYWLFFVILASAASVLPVPDRSWPTFRSVRFPGGFCRRAWHRPAVRRTAGLCCLPSSAHPPCSVSVWDGRHFPRQAPHASLGFLGLLLSRLASRAPAPIFDGIMMVRVVSCSCPCYRAIFACTGGALYGFADCGTAAWQAKAYAHGVAPMELTVAQQLPR